MRERKQERVIWFNLASSIVLNFSNYALIILESACLSDFSPKI